ncbi:hypothetical protein SLEP1_g23525 [Rubroshorea leprosula]|uniref:Uncharacterized protein n=1 Tax=Rubroshorea leprosula TaxID=152421 RepID=A0AAV5JIR0_9ROSI|nr:hypothetical protein SLEP1_g23525 [Rubroshorea leprosula]
MVAIMRELGKAMCFVCSVEFWRMAVLWTFSLLTSYWQLYTTRHSSKSYCFPRCKPQVSQTMRPVSVITGATSGLGAAAAHALSREGFYVVLGRYHHQSHFTNFSDFFQFLLALFIGLIIW